MRRAANEMVESVLRDYPRICASCTARERYIEAISRSGDGGGGVSKGSRSPTEQERMMTMKDSDAELRELRGIVAAIGGVYIALPAVHRGLLQLIYFRGLSMSAAARAMYMSKATAWRVRRDGLISMRDVCLSVAASVERWRDREQISRDEAVRAVIGS